MEIYTNIEVKRTHRFNVGDEVRHADAEANDESLMIVEELTYRVATNGGMADVIPTYTLLNDYENSTFDDIIDNPDLVAFNA